VLSLIHKIHSIRPRLPHQCEGGDHWASTRIDRHLRLQDSRYRVTQSMSPLFFVFSRRNELYRLRDETFEERYTTRGNFPQTLVAFSHAVTKNGTNHSHPKSAQ
jgi:hypothetical protein